MDEDQARPNGDGAGFDSTVYAKPKPTGGMGGAPRGPLIDPSAPWPWNFGPLFPPAARTTIPNSPEIVSTPSSKPKPTPAPVPVPSPSSKSSPPRTAEASRSSEAPQTIKEPERSPSGNSSMQSASKESSPVIDNSPSSSTPSTLETVISSSSSSLIELQPSISSIETLAPLIPIATARSSSSARSSGRVPPPASHTGNVSTLQSTEGADKSSKTSGSTIGGIVGGVSAAILIGLLVFFCWKWRTRGRYRLKNRSSFDPYGNGIDANRGGLLVSSVACKPGDQLSGKETLYSDDHSPTRYQHTEPEATKEPTIPVLKEPRPRTYSNSPPASRPPRVSEQMHEPFPAYAPEMSMNGVVQQPMRSHQPHQSHQPRPYPLLYERRRPPVPPSMRRNRSPTQPYDMNPPSRHHHPILDEPIPGIYAIEPSGIGFAGPYPQNSNVLRSNSINGQHPSRQHPDMARMDRNRRVRRSASMGSINHRGYPQGPPGMRPPMRYPNSRSTTPQPNGAVRPPGGNSYGYYDQPLQHHPRRNLTVRNPTPVNSGAERQTGRKPLTDMVRRATSKNRNDEQPQQQRKPEHAAKNF